jgi:hypothetical protein
MREFGPWTGWTIVRRIDRAPVPDRRDDEFRSRRQSLQGQSRS